MEFAHIFFLYLLKMQLQIIHFPSLQGLLHRSVFCAEEVNIQRHNFIEISTHIQLLLMREVLKIYDSFASLVRKIMEIL
jgi:hypothetical protein